MAKKNKNKATNFKQAGPVLSQKEVKSIAKARGITPTKVISKAIDKGIGVGSKVVQNYNTPGGLGTYRYDGTPANLNPLKDLSIPKGTAYYGASTTSTPATRNVNSGYSPGSVTYNPIVLPRNSTAGGGGGGGAAAGGGGGGGNGGGGNGGGGNGGGGGGKGGGGKNNKKGTKGYIDKQFDAYKDWAQTTIDTLTTGQDTLNEQIIDLQARNEQNVADITSTFTDQLNATQSSADEQIASLQNLMIQQDERFQQASLVQQQQAAAAQSAYEEQLRQANALSRAYVPNMEPTTSNLTYGSNRRPTQEEEEVNLLSNLTMLAPSSSASPVLAGLQIA